VKVGPEKPGRGCFHVQQLVAALFFDQKNQEISLALIPVFKSEIFNLTFDGYLPVNIVELGAGLGLGGNSAFAGGLSRAEAWPSRKKATTRQTKSR